VVAVTASAGEVAVTDLAEVLAVMVLGAMALVPPGQVLAAAALVQDSAGRVDLRIEPFLVGEIAVASVIAVSVGGIAAFAIEGFAILMGTLPISASTALDIQIIMDTITPFIIIRTPITIGLDKSRPAEDLPGKVTSAVQSKLSEHCYYQGPIGGVMGAGSRRAICSF
jgi:hypothetical protein